MQRKRTAIVAPGVVAAADAAAGREKANNAVVGFFPLSFDVTSAYRAIWCTYTWRKGGVLLLVAAPTGELTLTAMIKSRRSNRS